MFTIGVTLDIKSEVAIPVSELDEIIREALDEMKIDDVTAKKDDFYELVPIKGN